MPPGFAVALSLRPLIPGGLNSFVPNLILTIAIVAVLAGILGPRLRTAEWRLGVWLMAVTVPLAYTWTVADGGGTPGCHMGVPPWEFSLSGASSEILANIVLFVPAGAAAFAWLDGKRRLAALGTALAVPPAVELGQYMWPALERACQLGDVLNNQIGVLLGWSLAAGVWAVARCWPHPNQAMTGQQTPERRPS
jgi:hypothetical protein